jgi:hypothetical protein
VNDEYNRRRQESVRELPKDGGRVNPERLAALIANLRAENEAAIDQILDAGQRRRLAQIILQLEGPLAVAQHEVAAALKLGPEQFALVQDIVRQYKEAQGQLWDAYDDSLRDLRDRRIRPLDGQAAPPAGAKVDGPQAPRVAGQGLQGAMPRVDPQVAALGGRFEKESNALLDSAIRQVRRALTRRQRTAFDKLLGEPFDAGQLEPGGRRDQESTPTVLEPVTPAVPTGTSGNQRSAPGR